MVVIKRENPFIDHEFDSIRDDFLSELPDKITEIEVLILNYETNPDQTEPLKEIYRNIHSIKGSSSSFNFPELTVILQQFEELIGNTVKQKNINSYIEQCLKFVDHLNKCHEFIDNNNSQELKDYLSKFQIEIFEINNHIGRALIIDDSKSTINAITTILDSFNVDNTVEHDGINGLNLLIRQHFDLVITSQYLSGIDGLSIISALKAMKINNQNIPAILMTSNASNYSKTTDKYSPDQILSKNQYFSNKLNKIIQSIFHFKEDEYEKTNVDKILYIEDDKITQKIFTANISKVEGLQALIVEHREKVIPSINEFKPDIILLDNLLDGFTGKDVLKDIYQSPEEINIPILMLTATPQNLIIEDLKKLANVKGILSKPFHIKSLLHKLHEIS